MIKKYIYILPHEISENTVVCHKRTLCMYYWSSIEVLHVLMKKHVAIYKVFAYRNHDKFYNILYTYTNYRPVNT